MRPHQILRATNGEKLSEPFLVSHKDDLVPAPDYAFSVRFPWTGHALTAAWPFARRVGSSLVSSRSDPPPPATLQRVRSPTSHEPGCD